MRRAKSLRIGVHLADAVVWGPVYRTHLNAANSASRWPICRCISATDSPARTSMPGGAYFVSGRAAARSRADAKKGANATRASAPPFAAVSAMALVTAVCNTSSGMRHVRERVERVHGS